MIRPALALPALLAASPALALTPEELWGAWQEGAAAFGATLAGEAVPAPDGALALRGLMVDAGYGPEPVFPPGFPVQEVVLRAQGDAVAIDLGFSTKKRRPPPASLWAGRTASHRSLRQRRGLNQDPNQSSPISFVSATCSAISSARTSSSSKRRFCATPQG